MRDKEWFSATALMTRCSHYISQNPAC